MSTLASLLVVVQSMCVFLFHVVCKLVGWTVQQTWAANLDAPFDHVALLIL
jgi:hypothetical protein